MSIIRRAFLALVVIAGFGPAIAQAPPPVPALPDSERRTTYNLSSSTCAPSGCAVNFALYGDSADYANWLEIWVNGVLVPSAGNWTLTSPTGPIATIPRPITDAVITFNAAQTGTVQIVGARRPRRVSQFPENRGVAARDLNQALTDIVAQNRETWDKINDVTGRGLFSQPGVQYGPMPQPAACAGLFLGFDGTGKNPICQQIVNSGSLTTPGSTVLNDLAVWGNTSGNMLLDLSPRALPQFTPDSGGAPGLAGIVPPPPAGAAAGKYTLQPTGWAPATNIPAFTADTGTAPGTAGQVPAPPAGTVARSGVLGVNGWTDRKPLQRFVVPSAFTSKLPPNRFDIAPVTLNGSGAGSVTMSRRPSDVWQQIVRLSATTLGSAYVDPVNGSDANGPTCAQATPCKTLTYCFINCTATNIVGVATGIFDTFGFSSSSSVRTTHRLTFTGPAVIRTSGTNFPDPSAMTFTATGTPSVYSATIGTLTGSAFVQRFMYGDTFETGTGLNSRMPLYPSQAALQAASGANPSTVQGWYFDTAAKTLYVAFFGLNVNSFKTKFLAYYGDTNGDSTLSINGSVVLFIDSPYSVTLDGVSIQANNIGGSDPTVLIEGRGVFRVQYAIGNGIHTAGGFYYFDGIDTEASQADNLNHDPSSIGTESMVIRSNSKSFFAGDTVTFGTGVSNNRNATSAHGGVNVIQAGNSDGYSWGPNVADTTTAGYTSLSWYVGEETTQVVDGADAGIGFYDSTGASNAFRLAWIDSATTIQEVDALHAEAAGSATVAVKTTNNALNLIPVIIGSGASVTPYTRSSP